MVDFQVRVMETNRSKYSGFGKEEGGDKKKKTTISLVVVTMHSKF